MSYYVQGPQGEWVPLSGFLERHRVGDSGYSLFPVGQAPRNLGQIVPTNPLLQISFIGQQFREIHNKLLQAEAIVRRSPEAARAVGRDVAQARTRYSDLVWYYQGFRALVGLDPEPGLAGNGLGAVQFVVGGLTLAAFVAAVAALLVTVGLLLQRALDAEKTKEALSSAISTQTGAPAGTRFTPITTPSGQTILVSEQPGILDWILANPGVAILVGTLGTILIIKIIRD